MDALTGIPVIQTDAVGQGPGRHLVFADDRIFIPATRPSLRFPLIEAVAAKAAEHLWYFDTAKWPDRVAVDPAEYLGIRWADV